LGGYRRVNHDSKNQKSGYPSGRPWHAHAARDQGYPHRLSEQQVKVKKWPTDLIATDVKSQLTLRYLDDLREAVLEDTIKPHSK
jgi:hypothetical protein